VFNGQMFCVPLAHQELTGQDWQTLAPNAVEKEPEAQKEQVKICVAPREVEKVPAPHRVQFWMRPREEEKEPAGQETQAEAPREVEKGACCAGSAG